MTFDIPGAEEFAAYLTDIVDGELTITGPEIVDRSYNGEYGKEWVILLDGEQLGIYHTFGPKPGEFDFGREYSGSIPGYENPVTHKDKVIIYFSNRKFEAGNHAMGEYGKIVNTPWQRQDGVTSIPFP